MLWTADGRKRTSQGPNYTKSGKHYIFFTIDSWVVREAGVWKGRSGKVVKKVWFWKEGGKAGKSKKCPDFSKRGHVWVDLEVRVFTVLWTDRLWLGVMESGGKSDGSAMPRTFFRPGYLQCSGSSTEIDLGIYSSQGWLVGMGGLPRFKSGHPFDPPCGEGIFGDQWLNRLLAGDVPLRDVSNQVGLFRTSDDGAGLLVDTHWDWGYPVE